MAKSNKAVALPQPKGADGKVLTAEQVEEKALQPDYVEVVLERNGEKLTFFVACDFDQVENEIEERLRSIALQRMKMAQDVRSDLGIEQKEGQSDEDFKKEVSDAVSERMNVDYLTRVAGLESQARTVHVDMATQVVIGSNVPGMPVDESELKDWLGKAGRTQSAVLDAIVEAYDPSIQPAETEPEAAEPEAKTEKNENEPKPSGEINMREATSAELASGSSTPKKKQP